MLRKRLIAIVAIFVLATVGMSQSWAAPCTPTTTPNTAGTTQNSVLELLESICTNGGGGGGGGGGLSVIDEAAWTASTSAFTPAGGEYNPSAAALTSGQQGTVALTAARAFTIDALAGSNLAALIGAPLAAQSGSVRIGDVALVPGTAKVGIFTTDLTTPGVSNAVGASGVSASGATASESPLFGGGRAQTAEQTAVSDGQKVGTAFDRVGKQIMLLYANPENWENANPAVITDNSQHLLIAAGGSGVRHNVTDCLVTNFHATVGTLVTIQDGSTTIDQGYAAPNGGGFNRTYTTPRRGTANTALNVIAGTTGADVVVSCGGYKGS